MILGGLVLSISDLFSSGIEALNPGEAEKAAAAGDASCDASEGEGHSFTYPHIATCYPNVSARELCMVPR